MKRKALIDLKNWLNNQSSRKPLVIRGARQVGKTWLVRQLCSEENITLIEINFEKRPELKELFSSNDPKKTLINLEVFLKKNIQLQDSLLFLDEIQAFPEMLAKLRWFAEELPELAVIAAGSLLEFILEEHSFSMPVGRISYFHLEPFSFEEFLAAQNHHTRIDFLKNFQLDSEIPSFVHETFLTAFREYIIIGGLPAAIQSWVTNNNLILVNQLHYDILGTYRDDFNKYKGKIPLNYLEEVLMSIPKLLGEKFVYSKINKDISSSPLKNALQLLLKARLCHEVKACYGNGIPLGAEIRENFYKIILLDIGLVGAMLGIDLNQVNSTKDINLVNQGKISEQVVGQLLRNLFPFYMEPALYYWAREAAGSSAEVDYLIQHKQLVIPIEVKSGNTGSLKSLHLFMHSKKLNYAVRINSDFPSITPVEVRLQNDIIVRYQLISIPFYMIEQLPRLLSSLI